MVHDMIGWIYCVASCYIVATIARIIAGTINSLIKAIIHQLKKLKKTPDKSKPSQEVEENVC